jgi:putative transposase
MPDYRRNRVPGGTYFFTVNLRDRRSDLLVVEIAALRDAVRTELARRPFHIDAWVVLPDHMHCQWTLPEGDADFSGRMREIKAGFTRRIARQAERTIGTLRQRESGIWQRRFWEHTIRDQRDYAAHMDYIHFNPVKHGLVKEARAWEYSSFRRCVAAGLYPLEWGGTEGDAIYGGERECGYRRDSTKQLKPADSLRWRAGARPTLAAFSATAGRCC